MFTIEDNFGSKNEMVYDRKVTFYCDKNGIIDAEYYYLNGKCNYLISWGFPKDTIGEYYHLKARKVKKPFFSMVEGWFC